MSSSNKQNSKMGRSEPEQRKNYCVYLQRCKFLSIWHVVSYLAGIFFSRHLLQEKTNPRLARLNPPLWLRLRASCRRQPRRWGCHSVLQITTLNWMCDTWLNWWFNGLFLQGKPLPKTEQKFENFVKSSFKISDKKVSGHESFHI